jgi:hypothetical protein
MREDAGPRISWPEEGPVVSRRGEKEIDILQLQVIRVYMNMKEENDTATGCDECMHQEPFTESWHIVTLNTFLNHTHRRSRLHSYFDL